ncbi:M-phase inducer phosphatase [Strongylocentrotus purpuratus]|uniref:M-phase inducer phosphatase n=1 Tax=Strongylocentrotus purpuratus TaxID=7668 RepID=A0A7M7NVM3_STRPU|nr:M-phase inducer phosphatase [Strongylocentrotus purpuratus]XP_030841422.1 M-phase inducer phosphatase [Strongylocentrotus purpuratus]
MDELDIMERNKKKLTLPLSNDCVFSPCFSQTQASPVTALSMSMVTLSCMGGTPKRRLSMSSIGEASPVPPNLSRHSSHSSGVSVGTPSPCESPLILGTFQPINPSNDQPESSRHSTQFRRFNSMPLRLQQQHQESPSLQMFHRPRLIRQHGLEEPMKEEEKEDGLWMMKPAGKRKDSEEEKEEEKADSMQLDLPSPDIVEEATLPSEGFTFVMPKPLSARPASSRVSSLNFAPAGSRPISAPATLLDEEDDDDAIQLQEDRLTSFHDDEDDDADNDDGFSDIFDTDSQEGSSSAFSDGLAGLIHGALISPAGKAINSPPSHSIASESSQSGNIPNRGVDCNTLRTTPSGGPRCRKGIFKIPSQPVLARRNSSFLKRTERPQDTPSPVQNKRPRSSSVASPQVTSMEAEKTSPKNRMCLGRSLSMLSPNDPYFRRIDQALSIEGGQHNLTGDRTKACSVPLVTGKQKDLKCISPETMCRLLRSEYDQEIAECHVIDCRYPYEFNGGHIKGAINIYEEVELKKMFLENPLPPLPNNGRRVYIFHCEFSSQRGPKMLRLLRAQDRAANLENYPALYYPELYLLNEGYKAFFEYSTEFCEPKIYTPMNHDDHLEDLRYFRAKSKSWTERSRLVTRSKSLF